MNIERLVFTMSITALNIFTFIYGGWYIGLISIVNTIFCISFGITAVKNGWTK